MRKSRMRGEGGLPVGQRWIVSVSGQLTREVTFKPTFKGRLCSISFDTGRDILSQLSEQ